VPNESGRVVLKLSNDPRLVASVAGAVGHIAERAGFDTGAQADLVAAAEEALRQTFPLLANAGALLGVTVEDFPDRVEVTLEHRGHPLPASQQTGGLTGPKLLARVDRVQYDTQGGVSRMTLIKYIRPQSSESKVRA
jgi:anti-sigma regulatory factor (Ser/Thr protein kinase)